MNSWPRAEVEERLLPERKGSFRKRCQLSRSFERVRGYLQAKSEVPDLNQGFRLVKRYIVVEIGSLRGDLRYWRWYDAIGSIVLVGI